MPPLYLDYNATTPIHPEVAAAMQPYLTEIFGNPSSSHWYGRQSRDAIVGARGQLASLLGCAAEEIIFTSGGSESNNLAIRGVTKPGDHIITSAIEHPAVTQVCRYLQDQGLSISYLPVDSNGLVEPEDLQQALTPQTKLVTIMLANNEVGTIQPIAKLAEISRRHGALFHTDAAQAVGKIATRVDDLGVDMLSVAGHKFYAPKGVGALYVRRGTALNKLIFGADHERNYRAGTENVLEIVGLGAAAQLAEQRFDSNTQQMRDRRDQLQRGLLDRFPQLKVNGHLQRRLPNTLSISFPGVEANTLLDQVADQLAASAGAACHTDSVEISDVLTAMAVPENIAMGTIRLSTGIHTTEQDIDQAIEVLSAAAAPLLGDGPSATVGDGQKIALTHYTHGLGCACKLRPQDLEQVLAKMPAVADPNVLVGLDTMDDAAVYRISDDLAIVQTVDFFTPIVDDPYQFGAVAAANALSDIYAMGAEPLFALNVVGFPSKRMPLDALTQILKGAQDKAAQASVAIIGGHSIEDQEPKYGLAVVGRVHPKRLLRNGGAQKGDALVLTKPIGTGIISTAIKQGVADTEVADRALATMTTLNKEAAEVISGFPATACTDVTGFGLLGHLLELLQNSGVSAEVAYGQVPLLKGALELAEREIIPGGTQNNHAHLGHRVRWPATLSTAQQMLLCDAQTSGGLLFSLAAEHSSGILSKMKERGITASVIGRCREQGEVVIDIVDRV